MPTTVHNGQPRRIPKVPEQFNSAIIGSSQRSGDQTFAPPASAPDTCPTLPENHHRMIAGPCLRLKCSPYSITERRVPELIPVLGSQPAGGVSHKPGGRLPLLSARPAVTPATLKRAATNFSVW